MTVSAVPAPTASTTEITGETSGADATSVANDVAAAPRLDPPEHGFADVLAGMHSWSGSGSATARPGGPKAPAGAGATGADSNGGRAKSAPTAKPAGTAELLAALLAAMSSQPGNQPRTAQVPTQANAATSGAPAATAAGPDPNAAGTPATTVVPVEVATVASSSTSTNTAVAAGVPAPTPAPPTTQLAPASPTAIAPAVAAPPAPPAIESTGASVAAPVAAGVVAIPPVALTATENVPAGASSRADVNDPAGGGSATPTGTRDASAATAASTAAAPLPANPAPPSPSPNASATDGTATAAPNGATVNAVTVRSDPAPKADNTTPDALVGTAAAGAERAAVPTAATTATPAAAATAPPPPAEQIVAALRPLPRDGQGSYQVHIEMRPPELGRVELRVEMRDGVLHASIHTEHAHTADLVRASLDELRSRLEADGLRSGQLTVDAHGAETSERDGDNAASEPVDDPGATPAETVNPLTAPTTSDSLLDVRL